jgi:MinD superfamily P-loop ATPase
MTIAVLSGKGGTGKTTVAASLAEVVPDSQYLDGDVEEPNGFLFLKPEISDSTPVSVPVPVVDPQLCDRCGACAKTCQFNAIAVTRKSVLVFPELCHHCGACALVCQPRAITEHERVIGVIESNCDKTRIQGRLQIGEPVGVPIITALKKLADPARTVLLDCAPGAGCAVVRSLSGCDFALIVTEPTPFGLSDLKVTVELIKKMAVPSGVVINKSGDHDDPVESFCRQESLPILLKLPYSRRIAELYSQGSLPLADGPRWADLFLGLHARIRQEVRR